MNSHPYRRSAATLAVLSLVALAGCQTSTEPASPSYVIGAPLVFTQPVMGQPALFVGAIAGTARTRIHFTNVADRVPGNDAALLVKDENLLALHAPKYSPSGTKIAVIATVAYDQSEIVVVGSDGSNPEVASVNTQIIAGDPEWSPDGTKIAYGMSTLPGFQGIDLFVTDVATHAVTRLTTGARVTSAVRWSRDGKSIYFARTTGTTSNGNWLSEVIRVDVATKAVQAVATGIVGDVNAISRSGTRALVTRHAPLAAAATSSMTLVEMGLDGTPERTIISTGAGYARYPTQTDDVLIATSDGALGVEFAIYLGTARLAKIDNLTSSASVDAILLSPALVN